MFTGIITHIGTVERIEKEGDWVITIGAKGFTRDAAIGASISCSGACLTVIKKTADNFIVQASAETLARTNLGAWKEGTRINLERALKVGDELGGHFVSGHVDGLTRLEKIEPSQDSKVVWFSGNTSPRRGGRGAEMAKAKPKSPHPNPPPAGEGNLIRFIAPKGSVTLDGVSLTVNEVKGDGFSVNIIPHTLEHTTLGGRKPGDVLNLEIDVIARYLARFAQK